jgi:imidazolonepropionase-like amidohydrolase
MNHTTTINAGTIWTGGDAGVLHDASLVIEGDRIAYVGPRVKESSAVIDMHSAVLIPGLIDAHTHISDDGAMPLRLLSRGITTIRDTGNNHLALIRLRERQLKGEWTGPRIRTFGPLIDGVKPHWPDVSQSVRDAKDVGSLVNKLVRDGVDGLKVYVGMTPDLVASVVKAGARDGLTVTCHCSTCRASEALTAGVGCVEHVLSLDALNDEQEWGDFDSTSDRWRGLVGQFVASEARFCPTLIVEEAVAYGWGAPFRASIGYESIPDPLQGFLGQIGGGSTWTPERVEQARRELQGKAKATYDLYRSGVRMLVGSDAPFVPIGDGVHTEMTLLNRCGIPPNDVLKMATRNTSEYLGIDDEVGTLEVGKCADVVAIRRDPLEDMARIREIAGVWQNGRRLDLAGLDFKANQASKQSVSVSDDIPPWGIPYDVAEETAS